MTFDLRRGSRRPHVARWTWLAAMLGLAFTLGATTPPPAAAAGEPPAVVSAQAATTTLTPPVADPALPADGEPGAPGARPRRRLSPMAAELAQAIAAERSALTELQARFDHANGDREALAVQREIEQLKRGTEITLLRIQAKHARLKGHEAVARRIDAVIDEVTRPQAARDPVRRPTPVEARGER